MTGLSRFDMYPRDWISGTRMLSLAARGAYIDIIVTLYDKGEPIEYNIRWLCRLFGLRDRRQLQPILNELIEAKKIIIKDGLIFNNRAAKEIEKAHKNVAAGKRGGRPKTPTTLKTLKTCPRKRVPAGHQRGTSTPFKKTSSKQKQSLSQKPPSPSPFLSLSKKKEGAGAPAGGEEKERGNGPDQDPVKVLFDLGVLLLTSAGVRERQARSLVGRWRGKIGDEALAGILMAANRATEPVAYIEKAIRNKLQPRCETFI